MRAVSRGACAAQTCQFRLQSGRIGTILQPFRRSGRSLEYEDMANWSDPRPTVTAAAAPVGSRAEGLDAGLRGYMLSVYNYMASGVLLTGIVALAMVYKIGRASCRERV